MTIAGKKNDGLTPLELEIMQVLWSYPSGTGCTVSDVQPKLRAGLAYTTVQTMLNVLLRKGKVVREQDGRAFRYKPAVSRERASGGALQDLVRRMFGGSPEAMLMAMVDSRQITAEELERAAKRLAEAEREQAATQGKSQEA
jgi:predicted transcriptional regulator